MSIYMTKDGKYFKIGGYLEQRYYPRYFDLEHKYEGEQELYVVKDDTTDYYKVFNEMTVYQFRITETNTTETPKIRLRIGDVNQDIPLADVTFDENHRTVEIGSLLGVYQMYTLSNLEAMCYMETVSSGNLVAGVSAHKLNPDEEPTVENTGTAYQAHFEFGIPQGEQGIQGIQGEWGDGFYLVDPTVVFTFNETVSRSNILPKLPTQLRKDEILVFADGTVGKVLTYEEDTITLEKLPMSFQAQLTPASVTEEIVADNAITSDKIKDGTIIDLDVADNANIAQSKIAGLVTKLAALDKKDEDLSGDINNLNTNLDTLQETVTANESDIENKVTKLTETVNTNEKDIEGKVTKLTETVNTNKTELDTNIADLTDTVTANETDIEDKVKKLTATVNTNETDIEDKVTKLTATVNANETDIEGKVKSLSDTVNSNKTSVDGEIATINENIASIEEKIPIQATASNQLADKAFVNSALQKAVTLTGTSDPTTSTVGVLGQHYVNTFTNQIFHCVAVNGNEYIWKQNSDSPSYKKMTAIIDFSNSNPGTCVSYADDAIGMTADQWDSFFGHYPCLFKDGREVGRLDRNDFSKFADGRSADITSGDAGDVMIAFPRRGLKISKSGSKVTISMTSNPDDPDFKYYAHQRGDTRKEVFYMGAYKGYYDGSSLRSLSGKNPTANITIGTAREYAQANGSGYEQSAFYQLLFRQCAYILKYGSLDSQTAIGRGYVDDQDMYSYEGLTGEANAYGMDCETIKKTNPDYMTDGMHHVKCFGVEDFWGAIYEWIDGLVTDTSNPRNILTNTDNFQNDGKGKGYMSTPSGISSSASGYMKEPQGNTEAGFVIKAGGGSSSTYFADFASLAGGYVAYAGGRWYDGGDNAGAFYLYVYYSASGSNGSVVARLMYL